MMKHEGQRNKVRLEARVVITQMKNTIYIAIQTDWMLLEGLLFPGRWGGKYLREDISARHARASPTPTRINPPIFPHCAATSNFAVCFCRLEWRLAVQPSSAAMTQQRGNSSFGDEDMGTGKRQPYPPNNPVNDKKK